MATGKGRKTQVKVKEKHGEKVKKHSKDRRC